MGLKVISMETLRAARRAQDVDTTVEYVSPTGEIKTVPKKIVNGEMETYELAEPTGEMITTPAGLDSVIQKSVVDLELGREAVPLLYQPIYRRIEDANFTEHVDIAPFTSAQVVFLAHMEMEEVKFGTRTIGPKDTVPIITYAAGLQWTEDMVLYDKTWETAEASRSMGEAYNALLNDIHFRPILTYSYAAKNKTAAVATGANRPLKIRATIRQGLIDSAQDKNKQTRSPRRPSILLSHSVNRWDIEDALQRQQVEGSIFPALSGIDTLIFYDGYSITVGDKTYNYPGVDPAKAYLLEGQKYYRELVKHDLRVDAGGADLTRLIENAVVGRARRGLYASPAASVQELALPE